MHVLYKVLSKKLHIIIKDSSGLLQYIQTMSQYQL